MKIGLRIKEKQLEKYLQSIERDQLTVQYNKNQIKSHLKIEKRTSGIIEKRKVLFEYVEKYLEKYSEVDFSESPGCDQRKRQIRNQALSVLDAIFTLADQHRKEFKNFIEFVERRKGFMIFADPLDECRKRG